MSVTTLGLAIFLISGGGTTRIHRAQEDAIREAVFRYAFLHNASGQQQDAGVYCISIRGKDPSAAFLGRFIGDLPRVVGSSLCGIFDYAGVHDAKSGEPGLIFDQEDIYWYSETEVYVDGTYYESPLSAAGYSWRLVRERGHWIVISGHMHWIS